MAGSNDDFGLPSVSPQPVKKPIPVAKKKVAKKDNGNKVVILIVIILAVLLALGAIWYFVIRDAEDSYVEEETSLVTDSLDVSPDTLLIADDLLDVDMMEGEDEMGEEGAITKLEERNGDIYICVACSFDEDLAWDFAKKLSAQGISSYIIDPINKKNFSKVLLGKYPTTIEAETEMEDLKETYGNGIWVLTY